MTTATIRATSGRHTAIERGMLDDFAAGLRGELLDRSAANYDEARAIWNGMVDRRPALIARCRGAADVLRAVRFAKEHDLLVAVRGGGHNIAGSAMIDDGLVIDLSPMKSVRIDADSRTARVEPGATLGDFDREAQAFGLATPLGINSTTGIAGLTLGGGFGWLTRKFGMTVDNLLSADVVVASGKLLRASERENPDLFWALRGGGGNFGIVTSFEFQLHKVGPEVLSGLIVHPFDQAGELLRRYRDLAAADPDELAVWVVLRKAPPLPFLPESVHGTNVVVFAVLYAGDMQQGERALRRLRAIGTPIADVVTPHPYVGFQAAFDPLLTPGARNYWKSHNFTQLSDKLIDVIVDHVGRLPSPGCEVFIGHLGGAANRVPPGATAYAHRDAEFVMNAHGRWEDPAQDSEGVAWTRRLHQATMPYATGGVYVNFLTGDEANPVRSAYGANYDRLVRLKTKYDPTNLFRANQNIEPLAS
jgi:FAD/FMN-containing dehydrogenase